MVFGRLSPGMAGNADCPPDDAFFFYHKHIQRQVTFFDRLKGVAIALVILVICFPLAGVLTFVASPLFSWFEAWSGIEAYSHSGPAEWCFLVTYGLLVGICTLLWAKINRTKLVN